jgi:hypothetical protein
VKASLNGNIKEMIQEKWFFKKSFADQIEGTVVQRFSKSRM